MADPRFSTTLAHGLAVLQCFSVARPTLSNKELAELTALSKATISRLTYTLMARGLLAFDAQLRRYRLGSTALTIGYPLMADLRVRQVARRHMQELAGDIGGSVSLGMRDRSRMVYVETCRGHDLSSWRPDIGAAIPLLPTAMGRAWLASVTPAQRADALDRLATPSIDPAQARRVVRRARQELADLRFCQSLGDWRSDVHSVATPLAAPQHGERLVFNCGVLTSRLSPGQLERRIGPKLVRLAETVAAELVREVVA